MVRVSRVVRVFPVAPEFRDQRPFLVFRDGGESLSMTQNYCVESEVFGETKFREPFQEIDRKFHSRLYVVLTMRWWDAIW